MTHLATESDNPLNRLTGEAYLNGRREYWRNEAAKDRKNSEPKSIVVKTKAPSVTSSTNGLKGEAYLNSRREYWRKEAANDSSLYKNNTCHPPKKKVDESNVFPNILGLIVGGVVLAFIAYVIASGGGPLLVLLILYIGALTLKCWR
ncbi:hypothetical protein [Prevotella communis]|uniref:hypothetical protein n=1 Tax=Prevotella communis TaxID=2913614 RepID=UPI001EDBC9E8|nr:hypothetical protein [Prevotella communis]UKK55734.1 hypothetical protein L6476_09705 [Prevotella communis]